MSLLTNGNQHGNRFVARALPRLAARCLAVLLAIWAIVFPAACESRGALGLQAPGQIRPFREGTLSLLLPMDGLLTLSVQIGGEEYRITALQAAAGPLDLPFSGLAWNGEPLPRAEGILTASLQSGDETLKDSVPIRMLAPDDGIAYVVLSRETLPRVGGEDLYADHQLSRKGWLAVKLYRADAPDQALFSRSYYRADALPHAYRWDKTLAGQPAPAGEYIMTFEAVGSSQGVLARRFTLTEEAPAALAITPSSPGSFLPESLDDQSVWEAMMSPAVVVDIGDMQHQAVYSQPDAGAEVLGMVHGQTAALQVLENDVNGFAKVRAARHGDGAWVTGYVPLGKLKVIRPDGRYGLLVDLERQMMSVYERGARISSVRISTGIYVPPGTDSFSTVPGAFLTQDRIAEFSSEGYRYQYATRIDGGNLIHSTGYKSRSGAPDYGAQQAQLGQVASHGCVRTDNRANAEGINAWWLYANLPRNTKVLVIGTNTEYSQPADMKAESLPVAEKQAKKPAEALGSLSPEASINLPEFQVAGDGAADASPLPAPQATLPGMPLKNAVRITLTFGGDCVLGSEEQARKLPESFHSVVGEHGLQWPFSGLADLFLTDDLTLVNLENVLKDNARGLNPRLHNFRGPAAFADILKQGGIDLVNLANNHFPDYGQDGKNSTRAALRAVGIPYAGYSTLHVFEKDGIRVGFAGIRETVFHQNRQRIADEIAELKRQGCQYIVYTCHFGTEYEEKHNELQTLMAHTAIDAGADLVIGHHPHVVQGIEEYGKGLIFYSLGNLVFGGNLELTTFDGLVAQISLDFGSEGLQSAHVRLVPVITSGIRPQNDFRPVPAEGADKQRIMETINRDSTRVFPEQFTLYPAH